MLTQNAYIWSPRTFIHGLNFAHVFFVFVFVLFIYLKHNTRHFMIPEGCQKICDIRIPAIFGIKMKSNNQNKQGVLLEFTNIGDHKVL